MRLTAFSDYSVRTMMYLALHPERMVTIAEVSSAYSLSSNHLMKIVQLLSAHGLVATLRGKRGGLRLARPATAIRLGDIIRATEPDMAIAPCFGIDESCVIQPCCRLAGVLGSALVAFLAVLDATTLADLVVNRDELQTFLVSRT